MRKSNVSNGLEDQQADESLKFSIHEDEEEPENNSLQVEASPFPELPEEGKEPNSELLNV